MPEFLTIFIVVLIGLLVIGPRRLPETLEALWLALTDYQRTQRGEKPLGSLENARVVWISEKSAFYSMVQVLYRVTEHLEELRQRLLVVVAAFAITFILAFSFAQPLLAIVLVPVNRIPERQESQTPINEYIVRQDLDVPSTIVTENGPISGTITIRAGTRMLLSQVTTTPVVTKPTELFGAYIQVALVAAFAISLPIVLYQIIFFLRGSRYQYARLSFDEFTASLRTLSEEERAEAERQRQDVYDGLTVHEIRPLYILAPLALVFFVAGAVFTYYLILPNALEFLFSLGGNLVLALPSLDDYIGFALSLIFWVGLAFEMPLLMFFLARVKVVTWRQFAGQWRFAVVIIAVVAALITPTVDPFNMSLVMGPMLLLYVLGILFARLARP